MLARTRPLVFDIDKACTTWHCSQTASMATASLDMRSVAVHHAKRTPFKSMQVAL